MNEGKYPRTIMHRDGLFMVLNRGYVPEKTDLAGLLGHVSCYDDSNKIYEMFFDEPSGLYVVNLSVDMEPFPPGHVRRFVRDPVTCPSYLKSLIISYGPGERTSESKFEEVKGMTGFIEETESEKKLNHLQSLLINSMVMSETLKKYTKILGARKGVNGPPASHDETLH